MKNLITILAILMFLIPVTLISQTQIGQSIVGVGSGNFCTPNAINSDGTIVAAGAPYFDGFGFEAGHVRVFEYDGTSWTQLGQDIVSVVPGDGLGWNVDISSDGMIAAMVAPYIGAGHVKVYQYDGYIWEQLGQDIEGEEGGDGSAWQDVKISSDGSRVAVSNALNQGNGFLGGHVRVFEFDGSDWIQLGQDIDGVMGGYCSPIISMNDDGSIIAMGSPYTTGSWVPNEAGQASVYEYDGSNWVQMGQVIYGEEAADAFGFGASLNGDGSIVAFGSLFNDGSGDVRVFEYEDGLWVQLGEDIVGEADGDQSFEVSLSNEGFILAIGASLNDDNGIDAGCAKVYKYDGSDWIQLGLDIDGEAGGDHFGWNVELSDNGSVLSVGGFGYENYTGQVRVFDLSDINVISQIIHVPADQPTIQEGINAAVSGDTVLVDDGTYFENIRFFGKDITVASHFLMDGDATHIDNTIIDGSSASNPDSASTVMFIDSEDTTSIICGFTIQGGTGTLTNIFGGARIGGGIVCLQSGAKVMNNRILNNTTAHESFAIGGGIGCFSDPGNDWVVVTNNTISGNTNQTSGNASQWRSAAGGGMYSHANSRLTNNIIHNNECIGENGADGAGVEFESESGGDAFMVIFTNNNVQYNTANGGMIAYGGGFSIFSTKMLIRNNIISNNTLISAGNKLGAGISLWSYSSTSGTAVIENNEFVGNKFEGVGGSVGTAVSIRNSDHPVDIKNNLFQANGTRENNPYNGALSIWYDSPTLGQNSKISVDANTFKHNLTSYGGAVMTHNSFNFSITNNHFLSNKAQEGGAIYLQGTGGEGSISYLANNTFVNNEALAMGGAIYIEYNTATVATFNNIFWQNIAPSGDVIFSTSTKPILVAYSDIDINNISGLWTGNDNFFQDPELEDDSLHVSGTGPCFNAGTETIAFEGFEFGTPNTDIDGQPRPLNDFIDVGADEVLMTSIANSQLSNDISGPQLVNYPNPIRSNTIVEYHLSEPGKVSLKVYNMRGNLVETLFSGYQPEGLNKIEWNAAYLDNGQYFIQLITNDQSSVRKVQKFK